MPNMSYCRFQNTVSDLGDCLDHLTDDVSVEEHEARQRLIEIAREIVAEADNNPEFFNAEQDEDKDEGEEISEDDSEG